MSLETCVTSVERDRKVQAAQMWPTRDFNLQHLFSGGPTFILFLIDFLMTEKTS